MKLTVFISLFIFFFALNSLAQKQQPLIKLGLSYPFAFSKDNHSSSYDYQIKGYPCLSVEKPISIKTGEIISYVISPGVEYFKVKENKDSEALGGTTHTHLKNKTWSAFSKLMVKSDPESKFMGAYFGLQPGYNFNTSSKGRDYGNSLADDEDGHYLSWDKEIDTDGDDFFSSFYCSVLAGINISNNTKFPIDFEISYTPAYVENDNYGKSDILKFSFLIGFCPTKKESTTE
jgi:hypothetical protein